MSDYRTDADVGPGLSPGLGEAPKPAPAPPTNPELESALFHTQNSLGSVIQRLSRGSYTPQPGYNPVDDLKSWDSDEYLRMHGSAFLGSQSPQESQVIKAEIDQGRKDREAIAASGWNGTVAGLRMGLVDPTMFLPVSNAVRIAHAAGVAAKATDTALSIGKVALMQSTAQEALLQASQPERTLSESAINVGSSTLLAALIGAGAVGLLAKDGLLEKGVSSLDAARTKLSRHNGVMESEPERVSAAAVKVNDKIYTGTSHLDAMEKAAAELGTDVDNIHTKVDDAKQSQFDAWVTSSGRFVDSKEAATIVNSPHEKLDSLDPEFLQQRSAPEAANTNLPAGNAAAVGAAVADTRDMSPVPYGLDSIPGVRKAVSKMFPNLDVLSNGVHPAKAAIGEMTDIPIALVANKEGQTATRFGGPTIERELKQVREGLHWQIDQEMLKQWGSHLEQDTGATFLQRQTGRAPEGKMSFDDFDGAVYDALSTGDAHPVPQVAAMAQWLRKNALEPIKTRAANAIENFRETPPREGETYAPRKWDSEKISANWNDFVGAWTSHLEAEQNIKAQTKTRIEGLAKQLTESRAAIDSATAKLAKMKDDDLFRGTHEEQLIRANEVHERARKKIEEEIATWEGKTTAEAKSALKARAKAEEGRAPDAKRLSSADKAVDKAVKRILESDRDLSRTELQARAEEIASRVLGTPEGRLPYDAGSDQPGGFGSSDLRGHTASREIDIPYDMAKPWLRRSATEALKSYTHSVLPDAMLAERFDGDPNLGAVMKEIESAYAAKRADAKSETAQNSLKSQMDADIKNVAAMRDRIRGTFAYDPTMRGLARFSQNALKVNNIISSHGMAVASLPDFAGVAFRHGIESAFKDAWVPFFNSLVDNEAWQAVKAAGDEWKAFGIGIEAHSASRNHALSDIAEHYRPTSKFERALTWASDKAFIVNLLAPLTDIQKRMATNAVASNILRASEAVAGGTATAKQIQRLAEGNITEAQAARIWQQWSSEGGERVKGIILPNMDGWTDQAAALAFRGAVGRDVDIAVVQPGYGEIPKFMSRPGFNVLTQYKKFAMSATQRILISNLQRHDAGTMAGLITAVGMGMLSYRINTMASGQKVSDRPQDWFKEGVSRGGILGVLDDSNSVIAKATGGKADMYRLMGADKPLTKFANRDAASMFLGPSYGKLTNFMQVARAASHPTEWTEGDSHALRMMTMGTNFPYLPQLFDKVEAGANHAFGIPMKAKP